MSTNIDDFSPYVQPFVQGASDPSVINAVRDAAITLCSMTSCWREWLNDVDLVGSQEALTFAVPADAQLYRVEQLWFNRCSLEPITEDALHHARIQPGDIGPPRFYSSDAPGSIRLVPIPDRTYTQALRARVALIPTRTATTLPDFLFQQYAREIADGALAILHASSQGWAVVEKIALYQPKFDAAIDRIATQSARSNLASPRRRTRAHYN